MVSLGKRVSKQLRSFGMPALKIFEELEFGDFCLGGKLVSIKKEEENFASTFYNTWVLVHDDGQNHVILRSSKCSVRGVV